MGQSEVSKQMEIGNKAATFRIVDPAILPKVPVSPNILKMLLLTLVGGLGCGFGTVFIRENLDTRVRDISFLYDLGFELCYFILVAFRRVLILREECGTISKVEMHCVLNGRDFILFG